MSMQRTPLLLTRLLERGVRVAPREEVVTATADGVHRQSLAETRARACQLAHALRDLGVEPGDRVASLMWNGHRHLELYYAVPCSGAVLHTLNLRLSAKDLEYIVNHAEDRVIVVDESLLPILEPIADRLASVAHFVVCPEGEAGSWETTLPGAIDYEACIEGRPGDFAWPSFDENAPLGLCYTSGTTGHPKGVLYTHRSTYLHTMAQGLVDSFAIAAGDSVCPIVPMFHAMGWGLPFSATMVGAKQVFPNRFMEPARLAALLAREEITFAAGVPTIWQSVRAEVEARPEAFDLSALERIVCGGSAPAPSLMRWYWERFGVEMIQAWGMTETNPMGTVSRRIAKRAHRSLDPEAQFENLTRAGLIVPGLEMEIVDERFQPLPHDGRATGELLVRGPWVCDAYYRDPQPERFHGDWLLTGDVARIDAEEYLHITDRSKDLIKSGGEWISSVDLENHILALPGVVQAAVVAQPHPRWDERPVALVVRAEASRPDASQVREHCAGAFARWQLPDDVLFVDEIPLTGTGKVDKKRIREELQANGYRLPDLRTGLRSDSEPGKGEREGPRPRMGSAGDQS